ncbi:hypothetical protein IWQ60_011645, partial [Tieghemiomyces parasiticus]
MRLSLSFVLALALATGPLATLALPAKGNSPAVKAHLNPGPTIKERKAALATASGSKSSLGAGNKNSGKPAKPASEPPKPAESEHTRMMNEMKSRRNKEVISNGNSKNSVAASSNIKKFQRTQFS